MAQSGQSNEKPYLGDASQSKMADYIVPVMVGVGIIALLALVTIKDK